MIALVDQLLIEPSTIKQDPANENTLTLAPTPKDRKIIGNRWILRVKKLPSGKLDMRKSKVVAKYYDQ